MIAKPEICITLIFTWWVSLSWHFYIQALFRFRRFLVLAAVLTTKTRSFWYRVIGPRYSIEIRAMLKHFTYIPRRATPPFCVIIPLFAFHRIHLFIYYIIGRSLNKPHAYCHRIPTIYQQRRRSFLQSTKTFCTTVTSVSLPACYVSIRKNLRALLMPLAR